MIKILFKCIAAVSLYKAFIYEYQNRLSCFDFWRYFKFCRQCLENWLQRISNIYQKSTNILMEELKRSSILGIPYIIVHLGSHGGKGTDNGIGQLVKACNIAFKNYNRSSSSLETVNEFFSHRIF